MSTRPGDAAPPSSRYREVAERLDPEVARGWVARWEAQQDRFFTDREERFAVITDVVESSVHRPDPLVVDLGCGPGSLAQRLLDRLPGARVVGVDMDPLLLGLAEAARGDDRLSTVQLDLRQEDALARLGLDRAPDAFVSTTALHWMERDRLVALLRSCAEVLAPGGVAVDGDHLPEGADAPHLDELTREIGRRAVVRAERHGREGEGWPEWWDAVTADPAMRALAELREETDLSHAVDEHASAADLVSALRDGGCAVAGVVWQVGDDRVVVGVKPRRG